MKVTFFHRAPRSDNRSIERVFEAVESGLLESEHITTANIYAKSGRFWLWNMLCNMITMPVKAIRAKGVCHITGDIHYIALFMPRKRTVLTIHDLVVLNDKSAGKFYKTFVKIFWYYIPLYRLKYITCISEQTYKELLKRFPFAKNKIKIIPNPVGSEFHKTLINWRETPKILHIGTRSNKNLERVIKSLKGLECHLRIIGKLTEEQNNLLKTNNITYSNDFGLADSQMPLEYSRCHIVSFPSLFEGFGMPIIEGQASGRLVLTSDMEPMRSVSGGAAVLVDPYDTNSIRDGFKTLIENKEQYNSLINNGLINAHKYSVDEISYQYKQLYEKIITKSNDGKSTRSQQLF